MPEVTESFEDLMEEALDEAQKIDSPLTRLTPLLKEYREVVDQVEALEAQLKEAKAAQRDYEQVKFVELFDEMGIGAVELDDGRKLMVETHYNARILDGKKDEAIQWLADHGFGDLIKTAVEARFGMQEFDRALALAEQLQTDGFQVSADQSVHAATLKRWVREQREKGEEVPEELFKADSFRSVAIKKATKRGTK